MRAFAFPPPAVRALVHRRGQEGLGHALVRAVDLDAVDARGQELTRGPYVGIDDVLDLVIDHGVRNHVVGLDHGHRGRCRRVVQVGELVNRDRARLAHGLVEPGDVIDEGRHHVHREAQRPTAQGHVLEREIRHRRVQEIGLVADPAGPAPGLRHVVGDEGVAHQAARPASADGVRRLDNPIWDPHRPNLQRREEPLELRGGSRLVTHCGPVPLWLLVYAVSRRREPGLSIWPRILHGRVGGNQPAPTQPWGREACDPGASTAVSLLRGARLYETSGGA